MVGAFAFMQSASVFANTLMVTSLNDEFPIANDVLDASALTQGTFRWALANSSEGDTIVFADSIKGGTINMLSVKDVTPQQDTSFVIAHALTIYVGATIKMVNCLSVYCPNYAGWVGGNGATQSSTGNYTGFASAGGLNPTCINCLRGNYKPITDLDDPDNVAAASKLFATDYAYWEYPSHRFPGDESPVSPANAKVVYPKLADDVNNPNAPRVLPILENGDLGIYNGGYPVEVNDDFTWVRFSANGGTSWQDFYKDTGADESTLALITSDQRGLRYKDGMIPIGAAGIAGEVVHSGLLIIVK